MLKEYFNAIALVASIAILLVVTGVCYSQARSTTINERQRVLTGQGAAGDWTTDAPGVRRRITTADLPKPYMSESVQNGPKLAKRPDGALPLVPEGFKVEEFLGGLKNPRLIRVAPNGDIFVAESRANLVRVIRTSTDHSKPEINEVFSADLKRPFGIAFYPNGSNPQYIYIGNTDSIVRYPYQNGDLKPRGKVEMIVPDIPGWGELRGGGHWTRDIA
ncbi:MAG: sorbosone dehydrogenase family protein, partial [Pyrinomonadaceae bacterium]